MKRLCQKCIAEFIGAFAIVFFGCGSMMAGGVPAFLIPAIFGLAVAIMIYTVGHISGAHFNPAVTLAFAMTRHFPLRQVPPYWMAQFSGGIAAMGLLTVLIPDAGVYGATVPAAHVGIAVALLWETVLSALLMFVIIAVATDTRAEGVMAGMAIGGMVSLCAFLGGAYTGASMNPARSLAPALFEGRLEHVWIYMVAPFIGAAAGALIYQVIRCEQLSSGAKGCC